MAGISGVVLLKPDFDVGRLCRRVASAMTHRSPDGIFHWHDEVAAFGYGALSVEKPWAPATTCEQPMRLADGRVCVVDGFVGNRDVLAREFDIADHTAEVSDAQLLAMAYLRWGEEFWQRVEGDFALAVWDPAKRRLSLFRDRMGVRPLYYTHTAALFAFASESEPLMRLPGVNSEIHDLRVAGLWYPQVNEDFLQRSPYVDILKVPPAHFLKMQADDGRVTQQRYWELRPLPALQLKDSSEYVDAFREVFGRAVAKLSQGCGKHGLMLSGGIDSAAVLAGSRGFSTSGVADDLLCVSAISAAPTVDCDAGLENRNILAMHRLHPRALAIGLPFSDLADQPLHSADAAHAAWGWMQPSDAGLLIPALVYHVARNAGCRVVMDGINGDMVAGPAGNVIARLLARHGLGQAWSYAKLANQVNTYQRGTHPAQLMLKGVASYLEPLVLRRTRARLRGRREAATVQASDLSCEFAERIGLQDRIRHAALNWKPDPEQQRCAQIGALVPESMEAFEVVASRYGMEARHPWTDMEVIDFFLRLPEMERQKEGWTKYVVRAACAPVLGEQVAWHSQKDHHGALLTRQVVQDAAPYLALLLDSQRGSLRKYLKPEVAKRGLHLLENAAQLGLEDCDTLLNMVTFSGWIRHAESQQQGVFRG